MNLRRFLGLLPEYSLEQRIQILASSTAVLVTGVAIFLGTFLNQEPVLLIFGASMVIIMILINYYSRKPGNRFATYGLLVAIAVILPVAWIYNEGSRGPVPALFLFASSLMMVVVPSRAGIPVSTIILALIWGLMAIDALRPSWIVSYASEEDRLIDVFVLIGLIAFPGTVAITSYVVSSYREAREEAQEQRNLSDRLLHSILPPSVAEILRKGHRYPPEEHPVVSILFTDLVGFTQIAETLSPEELIDELDRIFSNYDRIAQKHGVQRIKTIGDSYMAVAGAPEPLEDHATRTILCALEMQAWLNDYIISESKSTSRSPQWQMRCGIHSGPVIAGVVGANTFAYDGWGDAVNTASRLESAGLPGEVNVSAQTANLAEGEFVFESRGPVQIKNKAPIEMFLVRPMEKL
ncbi:MAG: hypothetical protein KDK23_12910 [Leptospiraceae bacterium]|nr:hypothetical protein [Leptospiraceae bacterium]